MIMITNDKSHQAGKRVDNNYWSNHQSVVLASHCWWWESRVEYYHFVLFVFLYYHFIFCIFCILFTILLVKSSREEYYHFVLYYQKSWGAPIIAWCFLSHQLTSIISTSLKESLRSQKWINFKMVISSNFCVHFFGNINQNIGHENVVFHPLTSTGVGVS